MKIVKQKEQSLVSIKREIKNCWKKFCNIKKDFFEAAETFFLMSDEAQNLLKLEHPEMNWNLILNIGSGAVHPDLYGIDGNIARKLLSMPRRMQNEAIEAPLNVIIEHSNNKYETKQKRFNEHTFFQSCQVFDYNKRKVRNVKQQKTWLSNRKKKSLSSLNTFKENSSDTIIVHKNNQTIEITKRTILTYVQLCKLISTLGV